MAGGARAAVRMGVAFIAMAAVSAASLLLPDTSTEIDRADSTDRVILNRSTPQGQLQSAADAEGFDAVTTDCWVEALGVTATEREMAPWELADAPLPSEQVDLYVAAADRCGIAAVAAEEVLGGRPQGGSVESTAVGAPQVEVVGDTPPEASVFFVLEPIDQMGCFDVVTTEVGTLPVMVDCATAHRYQSYTVVNPDGSLAFDDAFVEGVSLCEAEFEEFVGVPYEQSAFLAAPMLPPPADWPTRTDSVCILLLPDEVTWTGNAEGSGF